MSSAFQMLQEPKGDRLKNNIKAVAQRSAAHIRNQVCDVRGTVKEWLQEFNTQAHQETEKHRYTEFGSFAPGQRKQKAKRQGHDNIQDHLPEKIPSPQRNVNKRHQIHRFIGVIEDEWDGYNHRHHGKKEY